MAVVYKPTSGQIAYEAECQTYPNYHDGAPRKTWAQLADYERATWEKNPTPRVFTPLGRSRMDNQIYWTAS